MLDKALFATDPFWSLPAGTMVDERDLILAYFRREEEQSWRSLLALFGADRLREEIAGALERCEISGYEYDAAMERLERLHPGE